MVDVVRIVFVVVVFFVTPVAVMVAGAILLARLVSVPGRILGVLLLLGGGLAVGAMSLAVAGVIQDPFPFLVILPAWLVALALVVFWLWMLTDAALHEPENSIEKLVWVLIILVTNVIGAGVYFMVRRPTRPGAAGSGAGAESG